MTTMPFGKHKGKFLRDIPTNYLEWLFRECNLRHPLLTAVQWELSSRAEDELDDEFPERFTPPAPPWTDLIRQWHREMALQFHPDRGGHPEAMKAINHAVDRLKELTGMAS
jgi:hypothetical protein